jgi:hypothetical protein
MGEAMGDMDACKKARVTFAVVNWMLTLLVAAAAVSALVILIVLLEWWHYPAFLALGVVVGAILGFISDRTVFQAVLGAVAITLLVAALLLAGTPTSTQEAILEFAYPFFASAMVSFAAVFTVARLWARPRPEPTMTSEDVDRAVARPHMG